MKQQNSIKRQKRNLRHGRVRKKIEPVSDRCRLCVFRSASHIYAQLIDDKAGRTLASASSLQLKDKADKISKSAQVGKMIAEQALSKGIKQAVFDRGGYRYHGRVKAVADAAREAGLQF